MTKELLKQALDVLERFAYHGRSMGWEKVALDIRAHLAAPAVNHNAEYEELRAIIDSGSESMTHEDAVALVKQWSAAASVRPEEFQRPMCFDQPPVALSDEQITKALRRAFSLGQTYWQQADSDSSKQHAKSDETREKFETLIAETLDGSTSFRIARAAIRERGKA